MRTDAARVLSASLLAAMLAVSGCGSDSDSSSSSSTSKSTSTTSTTGPSTTEPDIAIWPFADAEVRYPQPEAAAEGFAVEYLGFVDPVVGPFATGDNRSGEVTVQPRASGPVTTIALRQLTADDSWWVLTATTPNLQPATPAANTAITSPVTLTGRSTAFEGTVSVEVREDGSVTPVVTDFVTGGANGEMGPYSKAIAFPAPSAPDGAIVLKTLGGENGVVWEASVVRVEFG